MKTLVVDADKCVGCMVCSLVCAYAHDQAFNPAYGRIWVVRKQPITDIPTVCKQCAKPQCLEACQEGAITKREDGVVVINEKRCTGCGACVEACPFNGVKLHPLRPLAIKCDLCGKCVELCPTGVLKLQVQQQPKKKGR